MAAALALWLTGCQENVDTSNRYVFTKQTIVSYLQKHEVYSEYLSLLDKVKVSPKSNSTVKQLLTARGSYTCFAPTNEAIANYLGSLDKPGGEIPQTKRKVIYLHHEHTRTFSIGAVDSAIRDTFKL